VLDDEDHVDQALAFRDEALSGGFQMVAPSLWVYEVLNGLAFAARARRISAVVVDDLLPAFFDVGVKLVDPDPIETWRMAMGSRLTAYDAAYVCLAELLDCPCWTADRPLLRAGLSGRVRAISTFASSA
jgi:predicted nucleic acid-binding protein